MPNNQQLINELKRLIGWKKNAEYYAKRLNISENKVRELLKEISREKKRVQKSIKVNSEKGTIESTIICDFDPKSHEELAKLHKIDLDKYIIVNYWSKLIPSGKFTSSVFCKVKTAKDYSIEDFANFLKDFTPNYKPVNHKVYSPEKQEVNAEISIYDFHLAKRHIDITDNSVDSRFERYYNTAEEITKTISSNYNINKLVLPISNDFFHTDTYYNKTVHDTPQDVIMDFAHEYELGFSILVNTITMLLSYSKEIHVILVPGNHDRSKSFYLAHSLEIYFMDEPRVSFDRTNTTIKATVLGNTFIGYHHGNCKIDELPLIFATHKDYGQFFGNSKYREVHTGDKHFYMAKEVKGVRIQQMPSLSGTDRWHNDNNYIHNMRAALGIVYHPYKGKIMEVEERI